MSKVYDSFDLLLERKEEGFTARVINSPGGEDTETFRLGISVLELENLLLRIGRPRRATRRINSPEIDAAKRLGAALYDAAFVGRVGRCLDKSLAVTQGRGQGLRIRIRLQDVPELSNMPWELLYERGRNRFFARSVHTPIVRYLDVGGLVEPLRVSPPLRVLVMLSSPSDEPQLEGEREWQNLNFALNPLTSERLLRIDRLDSARLSSLHRELDRCEYHILHFVGHGRFNSQTESGELLLEDNFGRGTAVSGEKFAEIISDHRSLRLVVLNACEGARSDTEDPYSGTAQALVFKGIPSVLRCNGR
jgi:CHAT domain